MTYDLRHESWIPWRRRSGSIEWGPPAMLVSDFKGDPVVALATPRPDFDGALQEFLIGLLTAALAPADELSWRARWNAPPTEAELQAALNLLPAAFDLDGDGPRFLQDFCAADLTKYEPKPIEQLLIETPGEQTTTLNKDLFVKRERIKALARPAAAMALLTLQTYAPAGGAGNRTSMRGGGPLTTLIDPRVGGPDGPAHNQPLWYKLWANVETCREWADRAPGAPPRAAPTIYPWLAPTRVSTKGSAETMSSDGHPLQAYFGMPRRIRLEFGGAAQCDLTGRVDDVTVTGFRMRNYGVQYVGWQHPLSPHYRHKPTDMEWLPVHPQPGGLGWRNWTSLVLQAGAIATREPAAAVATFQRRARRIGLWRVRLHAFGFDMDNMKARGWLDESFPAFALDAEREGLILEMATRLVQGTDSAGAAAFFAVKGALFPRPEDARGDFSGVKREVWEATEAAFFELIDAIASPALDLESAERFSGTRLRAFLSELEAASGDVFLRWCPPAGLSSQAMRRHVAARYQLGRTLRGYGKLGAKLYEALRIPVPETRATPEMNAGDDTSAKKTRKTSAKSHAKAAATKANRSPGRKSE